MIKCPKCHYVRQQIDAQVNSSICPSCGIVYEKWLARQQAANPVRNSEADGTVPTTSSDADDDLLVEEEPRQTFREFIFYVPENIDPGSFWARVVILCGFAVWGYYFIHAGVDWEKIGGSFLHGVDLAFHEFGHIFFRPFGRFMTILGGSLFQCLLPLVPLVVFVFKQRDNFAGSIMLWWCGQNFIDVAPYINDAQYRFLPLVGGGGEESHDWGNLLTMTNSVLQCHAYALISSYIGSTIIVIALIWACIILYFQKQNLGKF